MLDKGFVNVYNPYVVGIITETIEDDEKYEIESKEIITRRNVVNDVYYNINFIQDNNMHEIRKDKVL